MFDATSFFLGVGFIGLTLLCIYWIVRCFKAERYIRYLQEHIEKMHKVMFIHDNMEHIEKMMNDNDKNE